MAVKDLVVKPKVVVEPEEFVPFDPWNPVLKSGTPSLKTTPEQGTYIKAILDICCSDSAFAKKAYDAIQYILTGLIPDAPVLTSLTPVTAVQGETVTVVVAGTGFTDASVVRASGAVQTTTFVSATELSFLVDTTVVLTHDVYVENYPLVSNSLTFDVTAPLPLATSVKEGYKGEKSQLGHELSKQVEEHKEKK